MDPPHPMSDAELILQFRDGRSEAFEDLVRRHMKDAFAFCLRLTGDPHEAEEVSQEGFIHAFRSLAAFRGDSSFRTWLFRILINVVRDRRRARRRDESRQEALRDRAGDRHGDVEVDGGLRARELEEVVRRLVAELPDRQREVLTLHVYHGLGYAEIGSVLGCSYDDVKVNLSLARRRLREALKEYL